MFSNLQFFCQFDVKSALNIASFKMGPQGTSLTCKQQLYKLNNATEIGRWFYICISIYFTASSKLSIEYNKVPFHDGYTTRVLL